MNRDNRNSKLLMGLSAAMIAALLLSGCAQTVAPEPNIIQRASGETPAPPPPSGFLGNDYSLLTPPAQDPTRMRRFGTLIRTRTGPATTRS